MTIESITTLDEFFDFLSHNPGSIGGIDVEHVAKEITDHFGFSAMRVPMTAPDRVVIAMAGKSHKTHYFAIFYYSNFSNPDDNGHRVFFFPKSLYTLKDVTAAIGEICILAGHELESITHAEELN